MTSPTEKPQSVERVAKVIARSGYASRRDAEKMILAGRVSVNGKAINSPALDVAPKDKVAIDGKPIDAPQETRLWLYYKPLGLITSEKDEQGRRTIFDEMPEGMPRVLNVGRLDLNSEGLLLLTNDGGLKRRLELPETGWLRKYRVRINGRPVDTTFDPLRDGITIDGEDFQPMEVTIDRQQGANCWLTVGIREGKNREIRRAMAEIGLQVNRLIRISYGPFRLNDMKAGDVMEIRRKVLRDQLGDRLLTGEGPEEEAPRGPRGRSDDRRDGPARRGFGDKPPRRDRDGDDRGERKGFGRQRDFADRDGEDRPRKPRFGDRPSRDGDDRKGGFGKRDFGSRDGGERPSKPRWGDKPARDGDERKGGFGKRDFGSRDGGERPSKPRWGDKPARDGDERKGGFGKRDFGSRDGGERPSKPRWGDKPARDGDERKGGFGKRDFGSRDGGERPSKPRWGDKPARDGDERKGGFGKRDFGSRDGGERKSFGDKKPYQPRRDSDDRPQGDRPRKERWSADDRKAPRPPREDGAPKGDGQKRYKSDGFRSQSDAKPRGKFGDKFGGGKPAGKGFGGRDRDDRPRGDRPMGGKPRAGGFKPHSGGPRGPKPRS
ncbi:pseudouridine synthase [Thioclava sp. A2]|uniref:pseudouridine synthase n=1 Tax=Thioclava sp. FCG-A2 TaxID=3080562 RepID=UPI002952B314|nr:pseudouridine synthase [Thioclava sp. A2]